MRLTVAATAAATQPPSRSNRTAAGVVAGLIGAVGLLAIPYGATGLGANPGFMPAFGAITFFADLITAALLVCQARATQNRGTFHLAIAYLFSVLTIVPHLLAFPGVFAAASVIGTSASAVWLWTIWHAGFALCVCRYALHADDPATRPWRIRPALAITLAAVTLLTVLATVGLPLLPAVLDGTRFTAFFTNRIGPVVVACNIAAFALVLVRLRGRDVVSLWLAVAMLAANLDSILTLLGEGRYALGWYLARCLSIATGLTVLVALLSELTRLFAAITEANRRLEILSLTDGLTETLNRRGFDQALFSEWRRAARDRTMLSLLIIDIDHFKGFNDLYGHPRGDACLRQTVVAVQGCIRRPGDTAARIGGEEFAVLLPSTDADGAALVAEMIHAAIAGLHIGHGASSHGRLTVSIGIATARPTNAVKDGARMMEEADQALYRAKQTGRSRSFHIADLQPDGLRVIRGGRAPQASRMG